MVAHVKTRVREEKFVWTKEGQDRVASAIKATLAYNTRYGIYPKTIRSLAKISGFEASHTSLSRYSKGQIENPSVNGWMIIQAIAPYIYRVHQFERGKKGWRVNHAIPMQGGIPYWEQPGITYAGDWEGLAKLGTEDGDRLIVRSDTQSPANLPMRSLSSVLQTAIRSGGGLQVISHVIPVETLVGIIDGEYIPSKEELKKISRILNLSFDTLLLLRDKAIGTNMDGQNFTSLSGLLKDLLRREEFTFDDLYRNLPTFEDREEELREVIEGTRIPDEDEVPDLAAALFILTSNGRYTPGYIAFLAESSGNGSEDSEENGVNSLH